MLRTLTLTAFAAVLVAPLAASAQSASHPAAASAYRAPRTHFGQPDLMGYWSNSTLTPITRDPKLGDRLAYTPAEVKALESGEQHEIAVGNQRTDPNAPVNVSNGLELKPSFANAGGDVGGYNRGWLDPGSLVMRVGNEPRTSLLTTKNGQIPPRKDGKSASAFAYAEASEGSRGPLGSMDNPENRGLGERCIIGFGRNAGPPMLPNGFYNNDYRIVQTPDAVAIEVEMVHDTRIIPLNAKHRTDGVRPWFGDSIGWWDGDTLVVETTSFPQSMNLFGSWKNLKVTERFTRVAKDRVRYQFKAEDPDTWAQPWGGEYEFSPMNGIIYEYACHEGNYALPGILGGARAQERERVEGARAKPAAGTD
jgi:hypothetical protein